MCAPISATRERIPLSRFPPTRWPGAPPVKPARRSARAPSRLRTGAGSASWTKARTLSSKPSRSRRSAAAPASPRARRDADESPPRPPRVARTTRFFSGGCWHDAEVFLRADLAAGHRLTGPAIVIEPNQTIVVEDGWAAALTPKDHLVLERVTALPQRVAVGTERRSGHARDLQQPLHVDRRADGRHAAEHRLFGEHQGAPRFLLRGVRCARHSRRQRAAHAGASRLDGQVGRDGDPQQPGHSSGRRLRAQRAL